MASNKWQRPSDFPYPHIWSTFTAKDIDSDALVEYQIKDLPPHLYEEAIEHMVKHFLKEEPLSKSRNMLSDQASLEAVKGLWRKVIYSDKVTIACFKKGSDEIIGMNALNICDKNDPKINTDELKAGHFRDILKTLYYVTDQFDVYSHYGVDKYLSALGLSVNEKYSGRGIGYQLLEARKCLCKSLGIEVTSTMFSSNIAQRCAKKAGFNVNYSITYDDLAKVNPQFSYPNIISTHAEIASIKY